MASKFEVGDVVEVDGDEAVVEEVYGGKVLVSFPGRKGELVVNAADVRLTKLGIRERIESGCDGKNPDALD